MKKPLLICFLVLLLDQVVKIWIKTHMTLGQEVAMMGDWFIIHFTENNGMAFGLELEGIYGKLFLSLFRIVAVGGIGYYLWLLVRDKAPRGLVASISLILAGAIGNILDSSFYGILFSASGYNTVAQFMPADGGYSTFLHGKVVDMLYFPLVEGHFPEWLPKWGGDSFVFFRPVFNIADSAISVGVGMIILFQKRYFIKPRLERELKMVGPDADTPEESIQLGHEWLVNELGKKSIVLDYSVESVAAIEKVIDSETHKGLPNKKSFIKDEYGRFLFGIAAYLGEVVIRKSNGLEWVVVETPDAPQRALEVTSTVMADTKMWPGEKVFKRLQHGKEEDLLEYVTYAINEVFSGKAAPSPAGENEAG